MTPIAKKIPITKLMKIFHILVINCFEKKIIDDDIEKKK